MRSPIELVGRTLRKGNLPVNTLLALSSYVEDMIAACEEIHKPLKPTPLVRSDLPESNLRRHFQQDPVSWGLESTIRELPGTIARLQEAGKIRRADDTGSTESSSAGSHFFFAYGLQFPEN